MAWIRDNIRYVTVIGESGNVNEVTVSSGKERLSEIVACYSPHNVWILKRWAVTFELYQIKVLESKLKYKRGKKNFKNGVIIAVIADSASQNEFPSEQYQPQLF